MKNSENNTYKLANTKTFDKLIDILINLHDSEKKVKSILENTISYLNGIDNKFDTTVFAVKTGELLNNPIVAKCKNSEGEKVKSDIPWEEFKIPFSADQNYCIKAIENKKVYITHALQNVLNPFVNQETSEILQEAENIKTIIMYPLNLINKFEGVLILLSNKHIDKPSDDEEYFIKCILGLLTITTHESKYHEKIQSQENLINDLKQKIQNIDKSKDDFLSVISHELRTPMSIVKSYVWMLQSGKYGELNDNQKRYVNIAMKGTERLIDLVNDMLNISRLEQGRMEFDIKNFDLEEYIKNIIDFQKSRIVNGNIDISFSSITGDTLVSADKSKVDEIITNLLHNAIKFTKSGQIKVLISEDDGFVKVAITDSGIGIKPENISALFKKFGRLDNSYTKVAESGGTGLGLHIVKLYTENMGGRVGAYSKGEGKGSTFWFTLPKSKLNTIKDIKTNKESLRSVAQDSKNNKENISSII